MATIKIRNKRANTVLVYEEEEAELLLKNHGDVYEVVEEEKTKKSSK